jgi:hypothetical protein
MKKLYTILALICLINPVFSQNKKEQIELLNTQKDSLLALLTNERDLYKVAMDSLNNILSKHVHQLKQYGDITDSLKLQAHGERLSAKNTIDSLSIANQNLLDQISEFKKKYPALPDYFFGSWDTDRGLSCCGLMGCLDIYEDNNIIGLSGLDWSSRFFEITKNQDYYILDILGFSEGECFEMTLVLLFENNTLFFKEYWNNTFDQTLPSKKELQPLFKCPK